MSYVIDSYTKLLIPFNGTDGDTNPQTALTGQTVTLYGNAQLDTAQKKFGTASLLFDGTGDYATVPDHADWYFAADPFTIDCWIKTSDSLGTLTQGITGQYTDANNYWYFQHKQLVPVYSRFEFKIVTGGVTKADYLWDEGLDSNWKHIELARSGTNLYLFIDGQQRSATTGTAISSNEILNSTGVLEIGAANNHAAVWKGWIDEFRISKGVARHTANFIPPNEASFLVLF